MGAAELNAVVAVRDAQPEDEAAVDALVGGWGGPVARLGQLVDPRALPVLVALRDDEVVGALAYRVDGRECEVVTIDARPEGQGAGQALLGTVRERARAEGCTRLWLVTTNDNVRAIRFYQRFGMDLVAVGLGAIDEARARLKPSIPARGHDGIPIRHELTFALEL